MLLWQGEDEATEVGADLKKVQAVVLACVFGAHFCHEVLVRHIELALVVRGLAKPFGKRTQDGEDLLWWQTGKEVVHDLGARNAVFVGKDILELGKLSSVLVHGIPCWLLIDITEHAHDGGADHLSDEYLWVFRQIWRNWGFS